MSNRLMDLKAFHLPKHCTSVYNTMRQDFTAMESYHGGNHIIIFRCNDHEVNSRNTTLKLQSNLAAMVACTYVISGQ